MKLKNKKLENEMKCTVSISQKKLKKHTGRTMTQEEFAEFCSDAITSKLWEQQIIKEGSK